MKYTYRNSLITSIQTIEINEDRINVFDENENLINQISFNDIKSITLVNAPNPSATSLQQCTILTQNNNKFIIRSYSYISLGKFNNQTEEYCSFLIKLHERIDTNENIEYKKGIKKIGYLTFLFVMFSMIILICAVIVELYLKHKYSEMSVSFIIVLFFLYLTQTIVRNIKPEKYNPKSIIQLKKS